MDPATRKVANGSGCGFHASPPERRDPLPVATCECEQPTATPAGEDEPVRCLHCAKALPERRPLEMTSAARRNQELADDFARRSVEAHEREQADAKSRAEADAEQRSQAEADRAALNLAIRQPSEREAAKQAAWNERLFGSAEPEPEPADRPQGDGDGGRGEPEDMKFEDVLTEDGQRMRVFTDAELQPRKEQSR
jgi:hypothetical protein